ncbi:hypothetical protein XENORESO_019968 [Xenotaenia resolanae]|uniref:Uncharacterized protein n=1 Tax=Xenotaenia resolanae TaxID=208358 RepID=A0ABV0VT19_9TELE
MFSHLILTADVTGYRGDTCRAAGGDLLSHLLSCCLQPFCLPNRISLTQLQQLRSDGFTDPGPSAGHYRYSVVEKPRSEHTGGSHAGIYQESAGAVSNSAPFKIHHKRAQNELNGSKPRQK